MFFVFFILATVFFAIKSSLGEELAGCASPEVCSRAVVVTKRAHMSRGENASTTYHATFEFENGERKELRLSGGQYGYIAEGDVGMLTRKGGRFIAFRRVEDRYTAQDPDRAVHVCRSCGATYVGRVCDYCDTPWTEK